MASTRTPVKIANIDDVADWAKNLPDAYLRCRLRGHYLDEDSPECVVKTSRKHGTHEWIGPCISCGAPIHDVYDARTGDIISHRVDTKAIEGYLRERGTGRVDAHGLGQIRLARTSNRRPQRSRRTPSLRAVRSAG